jgi:hypothetical protein
MNFFTIIKLLFQNLTINLQAKTLQTLLRNEIFDIKTEMFNESDSCNFFIHINFYKLITLRNGCWFDFFLEMR